VYCHDCNTGNTVDSKYCKECGAKINDGYRTMMLSVQDLPLGQDEETLDRLTRLLDMAFWHNEAGNIEAAITASEAALAINPNSTTAHSLLGSLYEKKEDNTQAIHHFESVLALNPDSAADAAKLDQIRRGVHVKAAAPPISHQLVPPVLIKLGPTIRQKWMGLAEAGLPRVGLQRPPLYAAGAVTGGILLLGLLLIRPWAGAELSAPPVSASAPPVSVNRSALVGGASGNTQVATAPPPLILTPSPSSGGAYPSAPALTHDPFAGRVPTTAAPAVSAALSLPRVPSRTAEARRRRQTGRDLPPLRLAVMPPIGSEGSLAPASVLLPSGLGGLSSSVASIPQHTVVVGSLAGAEGGQPVQSEASSHIRITVHQVKDSDSSEAPIPSSVGSGSSGGSGEGSAKAASYQETALSLQQGGEFKQARVAYQRAIRAYESQIASGQDVETAQRGLAACQIGLQICQQSQ